MIYELHHDVSHTTEEGVYDAEVISFRRGMSGLFFFLDVNEYAEGVPNPLEYTGNLEVLSWTDYPYTPSNGLLISKHMVEVLLAVRPFPHQTFPVRIYSDKVASVVRNQVGERSKRKITDSKLYTDKFVILKLTSETNCLDYDNTIVDHIPFRQTQDTFVNSSLVTQYAFNEPSDGFPPVFVTPEIAFYVWSEKAKTACEQAGLRGLSFWDVP